MSGSPTSDTEKKTRKIERGEFITPPRPTGRRSNKQNITRLLGNMKLEIDFLFPRNHVIMEYLLFNKLDYELDISMR